MIPSPITSCSTSESWVRRSSYSATIKSMSPGSNRLPLTVSSYRPAPVLRMRQAFRLRLLITLPGGCRFWVYAWAIKASARSFGGRVVHAHGIMHGKTSLIHHKNIGVVPGSSVTVSGHALSFPGRRPGRSAGLSGNYSLDRGRDRSDRRNHGASAP